MTRLWWIVFFLVPILAACGGKQATNTNPTNNCPANGVCDPGCTAATDPDCTPAEQCVADGQCVAGCVEVPDPDCVPPELCIADGNCVLGCVSTPDPDCPAAGSLAAVMVHPETVAAGKVSSANYSLAGALGYRPYAGHSTSFNLRGDVRLNRK